MLLSHFHALVLVGLIEWDVSGKKLSSFVLLMVRFTAAAQMERKRIL